MDVHAVVGVAGALTPSGGMDALEGPFHGDGTRGGSTEH